MPSLSARDALINEPETNPMNLSGHFMRMAAYNRFMNDKVYGLAAQLAPGDLFDDRRACFSARCSRR